MAFFVSFDFLFKNFSASRRMVIAASLSGLFVSDSGAQSGVFDDITFGGAAGSPNIAKGAGSDLEIELEEGRGLTIFPENSSFSTFIAGEGHEATTTSTGWYRIAQVNSSGKRANAQFTLRDNISGGGHSTVSFRIGASYNNANGMSFTLLSNSKFIRNTFSDVRLLEKGIYDAMYLEVKLARKGAVRYSIADNLSDGGWTPVDWVKQTSIPSGYTERSFTLKDRIFSTGDYQERFSVARGGGVTVADNLRVNGDLLSPTGEPLISDGRYVGPIDYPRSLSLGNPGGSGPYALSLRAQATGVRSVALGQGRATGLRSVALGQGRAIGSDSFAWGSSSAEGSFSTAGGIGALASGVGSHSDGLETTAVGFYSRAGGKSSEAHGTASSAYGIGSIANSYAEYVVGLYSIDEPATSATQWNSFDSVFRVGNGTWSRSRSDALVTRKNGETTLTNKEWSAAQPLDAGTAEYAESKALVVEGHALLRGKVIIEQAQGDISMGIFGN